jgi:hypothetical protein
VIFQPNIIICVRHCDASCQGPGSKLRERLIQPLLHTLFLSPNQGFERSREPRAPTPLNPPSTRLFVANLGSANENQLIQVMRGLRFAPSSAPASSFVSCRLSALTSP